jgi:hypothetical protein
MLIGPIRHYVAKRPDTKSATLMSDGAGAFSSSEYAYTLSLVGAATGVFIEKHIVTESGCGKNRVDGHFSRINVHLSKVVSEGRGKSDVTNAREAAQALASQGGLRGCTSMLMEFEPLQPPTKSSRASSSSKPKTAKDKDKAKAKAKGKSKAKAAKAANRVKPIPGLDRHNERRYRYDEHGEFLGIDLHLIALFRDKPDLKVSAERLRACLPAWKGAADYGATTLYTVYQPAEEIRQVQSRSFTAGGRCVVSGRDHVNRVNRVAAKNLRLSQRYDAKVEAEREAAVQLKMRSKRYHCPHPDCTYDIGSKFKLDKHVDGGEHLIAPSQRTDKDNLIVLCHEVSQQFRQSSTMASLLSPLRTDNRGLPVASLSPQTLCDGCTPFDPTSVRYKCGWALKHQQRAQPMTIAVLEFLIYLQERGTVDGVTKTLPADGARAMRLRGTAAGASIFTSTAKDKQTMQPHPQGVAFFKMAEWKDASQIKAYLRKPGGELRRSLARLLEIAANKAKRATDPVCAEVAALKSKAQVIARVRRLEKNLDAEDLALVADERKAFWDRHEVDPPAKLRPLVEAILRKLQPAPAESDEEDSEDEQEEEELEVEEDGAYDYSVVSEQDEYHEYGSSDEDESSDESGDESGDGGEGSSEEDVGGDDEDADEEWS